MSLARPTRAEIDLNALRHNFTLIRRAAGAQQRILAMVKADAYGHGAVPVARCLQKEGAEFFGVALAEEGRELRCAGIERPILVLGGIYPGQEGLFFAERLTPVLFDLEAARALNERARAEGLVWPCHLKLDTGMGRIGFTCEELREVLPVISSLSSLRLEGVLSHLALADEPSSPVNAAQTKRFRDALGQVREAGFAPDYVHLGNSAAVFTLDLPECTLVRPGIALYGGLPAAELSETLRLRPVMNFRTRVTSLKTVPRGTGVSYGHRFTAERPTVVATLPVGYADGYSRLLTNRGEVLIRGRRARIAGTVCMDWVMADVTEIPGVCVGDQVTLLGRGEGGAIPAEEWAQKVGSISYEVFCSIGKRVPRVYVDQEPGAAE